MRRIRRWMLSALLLPICLPLIAGILTKVNDAINPQWNRRISLISTVLPNLGAATIVFQPFPADGRHFTNLKLRFRVPPKNSADGRLFVTLLSGRETPAGFAEVTSRTLAKNEIEAGRLVNGETWSWTSLDAKADSMLISYSGSEKDEVGLWGTDSTNWKQPASNEKFPNATLITAGIDQNFSTNELPASLSMEFGHANSDTLSASWQNRWAASAPPTLALLFFMAGAFALVLFASNEGPLSFATSTSTQILIYYGGGFLIFIALSLMAYGPPPFLLNQGVKAESFYGQF